MNADSISPVALLCSQLPDDLRPPLSPHTLHSVRSLSAHTRSELLYAVVEQLAGQQPELFTALLQGCQEMPLEPSGSPQEDFVAPFIYQLLPPDVANNVDNVLGPRPQHWSQRMGIPYLEDLDRWLDETIADEPQVIAERIAMTVASGDPTPSSMASNHDRKP